ncbi:GNAT family N-acetyltransferase [Actibacterium sp. 188UL27-1]|uniref:GNAT family N-acetyltransferase n=1 Tax=Actibacterium sp. 188UL27-1 TaxID=2786961 RepID=UPI00195BD783|nr:GNAT family N-acetyltransferase [Actibacterium sp. 188UL27-1]MBM7066249.1 GNAT family N-acetyltransferase [Actibacterium sp. 188UL27-1]
MIVPTLRTERLILRAPTMADWPVYRAFITGARAVGAGGILDEKQAFRSFAAILGHWHLKGFGWWMIEHDGQPVGYSGVHNPPSKADMELGWALFDGHEGHGFALEAARAGLSYAKTVLTPRRLVSYIIDGNTPSEKLARKLGAAPASAADHRSDVTVWVHPMESAP